MLTTEAQLTFSDKEVEYKIFTQDGLTLTVKATYVVISDNGSFFFYNGKKFIMFVDRARIVSTL